MQRVPWFVSLIVLLLMGGSRLALGASSALPAGGNLGAAVSGLKAGDTLTLAKGTYNCSGCLSNPPSGASSARVTIAGDPGGGTVVKLSGGGNGLDITSSSYVTFDHIDFDCSGVGAACIKITCGGSSYGHHIRISNSQVHNAGTQGILANAGQCNASYQGGNEFLNLHVHHNGTSSQFDHGLYICGSDNLIDQTVIESNTGCGVHIYCSQGNANRNVIRNSKAFGQNGQCGVGILYGNGDDNMAYNNLVYGNGGGIMLGNGGSNTQAYNNTVVNNQKECFRNDNGGSVIRNNICFGNGSNGISGSGGGATQDHNLFGTDPKFVSSSDYHLASGSPAIKAGADLSSIFRTDITGATRPSGAFDLGAYAVGGTGGGGGGGPVGALPAPTNLRLISPQGARP